jgi:uncharacterized protein (DUF608 family)
MTTKEHIKTIEKAATNVSWDANMALCSDTYITSFDEAAEACALAISEYLNARQQQRDAEMERMVERGQDAAQEARGRSGKFHYDEEMPLEHAFEG